MSVKWISITRLLLQLTAQGKLQWAETADPESFQTKVDGVIMEVEVMELFEDFTVRIYDRDGKVADTFGKDDLIRLTGQNFYSELDEMLKTIRRQLSGAERVIDDLLVSLQKKMSNP